MVDRLLSNTKLFSLLEVRPYSLVGIISISLLSYLIAFPQVLNIFYMAVYAVTALLLWVMTNYAGDFIHKHTDNRFYVPFFLSPIIFLFLVFIFLINSKFISIYFLILLVITIPLYSFKNKYAIISKYSFFIRGFLEVYIFFISYFILSTEFLLNYFWIPLSIYFVTASRNLIGDVRDKDVDKSSFPKSYGVTFSYITSTLMLILVVILTANLEVLFPISMIIFLMFLFKNKPYTLHRIFVLASTVFYLNIVSNLLNAPLFINNLIFVALILNLLYPIVPRKVSPEYM